MIPLLLAVALPALANGWVGHHVEDTGSVYSADFRAAYVLGAESTTAVIQSGVQTDAARFAWVLPVPAPIVQDRVVKVAPEAMDALLAGTDPRYAWSTSCGWAWMGMYACAADRGADSGGARAGTTLLRELDVGPYELALLDAKVGADVTGWLTERGYAVPAALEPLIDQYLAEGWLLLAVSLELEELPEDHAALPALAFTYQSTRVAYPIRISAGSALDDVETLVFTIGPRPTAPEGEPWVQPELGQGFVGDDFATWYGGVARAAVAEAGQGQRAWLLEHNQREGASVDSQGRYVTDGASQELVTALLDLDLLDAEQLSQGAVVTRYRTWLSADQMGADLVLVPDDSVPDTVIELGRYQGGLLLLGLGGWALRRRRTGR